MNTLVLRAPLNGAVRPPGRVATLMRGFLIEYVRNRTNLLVLLVVPVTFVALAADTLARAARILGGEADALQQATAGWAAAFLAAVGMFFQVSAARETDRRLVLAGMKATQVVVARMLTGGLLAVLACAVSLAVLAARGAVNDPGRLAAGTLMFALVYLGLGAIVGAVTKDPVNGTVVILFIWIIDVFFGPTLSATTSPVTWVFPTHFIAYWAAGRGTGHAGFLGELGLGGAWVLGVLALALLVLTLRTAPIRTRTRPARRLAETQWARTVFTGARDVRRNHAFWVLLVVVPTVFVVLADLVTPHGTTTVSVREHGRSMLSVFDPADIHAGTMAPIAVASLAMLIGLFASVSSRAGDNRVALAGMPRRVVIGSRLAVTGLSVLVAVIATLVTAGIMFRPANWAVYAVGNLAIGVVYALVGFLLGPLLGRASGVFIAFLLPFLDVGLTQSPMLSVEPGALARWLPGYGPTRLVIDGGLTAGFDETGGAIATLTWLILLTAVVAVVAWRTIPAAPTRAGTPRVSVAQGSGAQ